nr:sulfatase [Phycisphaerales bacterium]
MQRRNFLRATALGSLGVMVGYKTQLVAETPKPAKRKPNVVLIFTDDQGYGDLSCFGAKDLKTPHIDSIAANGLKLTDFYVPTSCCSPSRAALLTGCYPKRVGLHKGVLFPDSRYGLNPAEELLPELLKRAGYATGMYGKWHLGHHKTMMPTAQGFDEYFGVPYSNDMSHFAQDVRRRTGTLTSKWKTSAGAYRFPKLPLIHNGNVLELEPDQTQLTKRYTEKACEFITANKDKPFFVYLPHSMPHLPWVRSKNFEGSSKRGVYGDVIQEIDWSVGEVLKTLRKHGLEKDTLVIFTSDNGGQTNARNGAVNRPLRGGKSSHFDGGLRVPCVMQMPDTLPAGKVCKELTVSFDLLPTICKLAGAPLPKEKIDGQDIWPILSHPETAAPERAMLVYPSSGKLMGIRVGKWKLLSSDLHAKGVKGARLHDLRADIGEEINVAAKNPAVVKRLRAMAISLDKEVGANARPVARVKANDGQGITPKKTKKK